MPRCADVRQAAPPLGDRGREQARWNADREFLELATAGAAQVLGPDHGVTKALAKASITMSPAPPQSPGRHAGCHRCTAPHHMRSRFRRIYGQSPPFLSALGRAGSVTGSVCPVSFSPSLNLTPSMISARRCEPSRRRRRAASHLQASRKRPPGGRVCASSWAANCRPSRAIPRSPSPRAP